MIAYFRLAVNPNDEEALKRVINYPTRGIGQTTVDKVTKLAAQQGVSLWQVITNAAHYQLDVNRGTLAKLEAFAQLIEGFRAVVNDLDAAQLGLRIAKESGVSADLFSSREPEYLSKQENLQELIDGMQQFVDDRQEEEGNGRSLMTHYLQKVSLISDLDESDDDSEEKLTLMTVHAAKGLEFRVVFVVGMEENLFPNQMSATSPRELEEERRLFYVAITRAKEQCYLTHAQNRYRFGKSEFCTPSSFLSDIDPRFVTKDTSAGRRSPFTSSRSTITARLTPHPSSLSPRLSPLSPHPSARPNETLDPSRTLTPPLGPTGRLTLQEPSSLNPSPSQSTLQTPEGTIKVGTYIEHSRFGRGEIIALSGSGIDAKATVKFDNVGTKQLLLRFAKFTILG